MKKRFTLSFLLLTFVAQAQLIPFGFIKKNVVPTVSATTEVSSITLSTAISGGTINSSGGATITVSGLVWGVNTNPTIALPTKTTDGTASGTFSSSISGLEEGTTYYVRAYATNSVGTSYGPQISFTSLIFVESSVVIGTQTWKNKNLEVSTYRNGDQIPQVTDPAVWRALTTGAWCYFNNDPANGTIYGKLYNWYAVNDSRGLAPSGWHIPTDAEFITLTNYLGGSTLAGGKMKFVGTTRWITPNTDATNESGFRALPGGFRYYESSFLQKGVRALFWTATASGDAVFYNIYNNSGSLTRGTEGKVDGFSVRIVQD